MTTDDGRLARVTVLRTPGGMHEHEEQPETPEQLLVLVARGDRAAFDRLYDRFADAVFGLVRRVLRDPAQSEEVTQEVLVDLWRTASAFDPDRGSAATWVMTLAHRRAVDRVRSAQASTVRDTKDALLEHQAPYDVVAETVERRLEREQVVRALTDLTELQREAVTLAFYGGYTHVQVADLLDVPLGTVKTRIRDGLIRMRDSLGVTA
jgi:RNA polymerase sigma-70 factor, ECF subfamily